jgi:hypothetical protein
LAGFAATEVRGAGSRDCGGTPMIAHWG